MLGARPLVADVPARGGDALSRVIDGDPARRASAYAAARFMESLAMWVRLDDPKLVDKYRAGFFGSQQEPEGLAELLAELARAPFAGRVWAVTTLNALRFTTASSFEEEEKHGTVWVGRTVAGFVVSFAPPAGRVAAEPTVCGRDSLTAAVERHIEGRLLVKYPA